MNLSKTKHGKMKKAMSLFLGSVLVLNTAAMVKIKANDTSVAEAKELRDSIIEKAAAYLSSQQNADKSYGDSRLINDTTEALIGLRAAGKDVYKASIDWVADNISFDNNDMTARLAAASLNKDYLTKLRGRQNEDGGFGLHAGYDSDALDTVLALEAMNDNGFYTESALSADQMCMYFLVNHNSDGGVSYSKASDSDDTLTAMMLYNCGRYFVSQNHTLAFFTPTYYYVEEIADSYEDKDLKTTLYKYLAIDAVQTGFDNADFDDVDVLYELSKAVKKNGSFADDIETTSVAIRLLKELDLESTLKVTDFNTTLSKTVGTSDKSNTVTAKSTIAYTGNYDADLDVKLSLHSGDAVVYEETVPAHCPADQTLVKVESSEFTIAEPDGSEVYLIAELYNGTKLEGTIRINIDITAVKPDYQTEINDLVLSFDKHSAVAGEDTEVGVIYDLRYATNVEYPVQMKTVVKKDGKLIDSKTEDVVLTPESTSIMNTPVKLDPEASSAGIYNITVSCIDGDKEIITRNARFEVIDPPVIEEKQSEEEETTFEVTWFGPVLSDYCVYAGNETDITAGADINYFSNGPWNGSIEMNVYKKDELITETSFDVSLEKGVVSDVNGVAKYPVYNSGDKLSFTVKDTGEYTVNAKLLDAEGNVIKEGKNTLRVIDKPVQDLILNSSVNPEKSSMIDLSWNDISNSDESYSYQLYRKTNGQKWEPRSIWNEEEHIRVLNIYPASPYLADWMTSTISETETPAGKGIFDIDSVHIQSFNSDPKSCLINEDGSWKYDVIFFGSSDCNSSYDLNDDSLKVTADFIDSGRGALFGHDTICGGSGWSLHHVKFNELAERAGLTAVTPNPEVWHMTSSASVVKLGTLTNYPWEIRGNLTVPYTHATGQFLNGAIEWITLNAEKRADPATGGLDNFYLATNNNVGMIQTGHSNGQATDDERKILANTMFYLYQISQQTTAKDASFYDIDAPDKPAVSSVKNNAGKAVLNVSSKDNPTEYEYYISANPASGSDEKVLSNVRKHTALAGLAGFVVKVSPSSEPAPELIEHDENGENILGIVPADAQGKAVLEAVPKDMSEQQFIHVFAVDKANNISEEYIVPFAETELKTNIDTDKKLYAYGDKVAINADTISAPFGRKADMSIAVFDEFGNKKTELSNVKDQVLAANETLESNAEWSIPAETDGRYKAVISWTKDDEVIATAESGFKIANEKSISNFISSDKKSYSVKEPINLLGTVSNNSKGMTENDLVLSIRVYDKTNKAAAAFDRVIGGIVPSGSTEHSDAIAPGELAGGSYHVVATVMQDDLEVSSDTADFTVETAPVFTGDLTLSPSGDKASADFTVLNSGTQNAEDVLVTVRVYKADTSELIHTYTDTVNIKAGENFTGKTAFDVDPDYEGKYSAVLSASYKGTENDLDFAGFEHGAAPAPTTEPTQPASTDAATTTTTASSSTSTTKTTSAKTDSPKTGDNGIPAYMWAISIFSIAGLVVLRRKGGSESE